LAIMRIRNLNASRNFKICRCSLFAVHGFLLSI